MVYWSLTILVYTTYNNNVVYWSLAIVVYIGYTLHNMYMRTHFIGIRFYKGVLTSTLKKFFNKQKVRHLRVFLFCLDTNVLNVF